jgi:hypothetical protein
MAAGGRRDHARAPADEGGDHGDAERGVEPDLRVDAGDDGEGDGLRDQRQRDHQAGEQVVADVLRPLATFRPMPLLA